MAKVGIIGAGFSGLSAAAYLSASGHEVHVFEKNSTPGGRARQLHTDTGYVFDMGPSWYWMPDVFERFFEDLGYKVSDLYDLRLLDPGFEVVFGEEGNMMIPHNFERLKELFEEIEAGSSAQLEKFMEEAQFKYKQGMENLVYMPGLSLAEFADMNLLKGALRLQVFSSFSKHVRKFFKDPRLIALMEFPVLFLGAMPQDTPALYSLMNYAGLKLGTWYPDGGFGQVIQSILKVAEEKGASFYFDSQVEQILVEKNLAIGLIVQGETVNFDVIIGAADYHHVEQKLLLAEYRNYNASYWEERTFAPSCLIYYLGFSKKFDRLKHHTLFFEEDLFQHSIEIYKNPKWPTKPLFYVCSPSQTDDHVAPEGHENLFLLMPLAPDLEDGEKIRERYFQVMMDRLEEHTGEKMLPYLDHKQSYCVSDFIADYNSCKGNAYGLANTLKQTAVLKPRIRNRKVKNLYYAGQLTVPGPGVPPALISGKIVADQVIKNFKAEKYEVKI